MSLYRIFFHFLGNQGLEHIYLLNKTKTYILQKEILIIMSVHSHLDLNNYSIRYQFHVLAFIIMVFIIVPLGVPLGETQIARGFFHHGHT